MKDRNYLINMYNATSTDDGTGEIETYEAWLERQLLSRIEKLEQVIGRCTECQSINTRPYNDNPLQCLDCGHVGFPH